MSPDAGHSAGGVCSEPIVVRVEHDGRGAWSGAMPGDGDPVTCDTFDDARRVAYLCAARKRPCELIVHDAYHRVLHRELINGHRNPRPSPPTATTAQPTHQGGR